MTKTILNKFHPLSINNFIFRLVGYTAGFIILMTIFDITKPDKLPFFLIGPLWPPIALLLTKVKFLSKKPISIEYFNLCIDAFILGVFAFNTSFNVAFFFAYWISSSINSISTGGIKLFLISLIFLFLGFFLFYPFFDFTMKLESKLATVILSIIFTTSYILITAISLNKALTTNRKKRKQILVELEFAKTIQNNLLPQTPPAKNIAFLYKPMRQIGGDFYDFIRFRDSNKIGIFISDVSGHGVPAAFITSMIKSILLQAGEKKDNPAELLNHTNKLLQKYIFDNFITAFYGIYDPSDRSIFYSNAGHNFPYIIQDDITQLHCEKSKALVMFNNKVLNSNLEFKNQKQTLAIGSKLFLYTDGLTEARPIDGENFFEVSKIRDVFLENKDKSCGTFIKELHKELVSFRKTDSFDDDICMVCLDIK